MKKKSNVWDSTSSMDSLSAAFKALGQPTRLVILKLLVKYGKLNCGEIVDKIPRSQSTVSQHLQALYRVGMLSVETKGPVRYYSINPVKMKKMSDKMLRFIEDLEPRADAD